MIMCHDYESNVWGLHKKFQICTANILRLWLWMAVLGKLWNLVQASHRSQFFVCKLQKWCCIPAQSTLPFGKPAIIVIQSQDTFQYVLFPGLCLSESFIQSYKLFEIAPEKQLTVAGHVYFFFLSFFQLILTLLNFDNHFENLK